MPWPATIPQTLLREGFNYTPVDNKIESPTDHGISQTRPRFSGRLASMSGQVWLVDGEDVDDLMTFFWNEVGCHTYFDFVNPFTYSGAPANLSVRFTQAPSLIPRGGAGFKAQVSFERAPFTSESV